MACPNSPGAGAQGSRDAIRPGNRPAVAGEAAAIGRTGTHAVADAAPHRDRWLVHGRYGEGIFRALQCPQGWCGIASSGTASTVRRLCGVAAAVAERGNAGAATGLLAYKTGWRA